MRLLLDSHVVLWWLGDDAQLAAGAREMIAGADDVAVSVVTLWELGIKKALGKLDFPDDLDVCVEEAGFGLLPIHADHAMAAPTLPPHHGDPFDRMLLAQALVDQRSIVTADTQFAIYGVPLISAR